MAIGCKGPKGLIRDAIFLAKGTQRGIEIGFLVESILQDFGFDPRLLVE